jgi:hypothetical protein
VGNGNKYFVEFEKRSVIKLQFLTDFIAEWTKSGQSTDTIIPEALWLVY